MFWPEPSAARRSARGRSSSRSALMGSAARVLVRPVPRQAAAEGRARRCWHQDEGYWGRNLDDRGITCWMPFHDVDERNGCMHFIDGGHRDGVLEHRQPEDVQSDLLFCEPDESRAVACPISLGSVTFHHSQDAAHDDGQLDRRVAPDPDAAPPQGRRAAARATTTRGRST